MKSSFKLIIIAVLAVPFNCMMANNSNQNKTIVSEITECSKIAAGPFIIGTAYGFGHRALDIYLNKDIDTYYRNKCDVDLDVSKMMIRDLKDVSKMLIKQVAPNAVFGVALAAAARSGSWPKLKVSDYKKAAPLLAAAVTTTSLLTGIGTYFACKNRWIKTSEELSFVKDVNLNKLNSKLSKDGEFNAACMFKATDFSCGASFLSACAGMTALCGWTLYERYKRNKIQKQLKEKELAQDKTAIVA